MVVVDMINNKVGPVFSASNCGLSNCTVDWVSVSPTGKFAVVSTHDQPHVYDINPNTLALSTHPEPAGTPECQGKNPSGGFIFDLGHADMTIENGDDVIVGQNRSWCPGTVNGATMGQVIKVRLKDNVVTSLTKGNEAQAHHISLRSYDRPGWAYVTYYNIPGKLYSNEVIAVKIDGSGQVERFTHTHSTAAPYRNEEHAVPSRDGMRIIFASGWDVSCGNGCGSSSNPQAYVVDARK